MGAMTAVEVDVSVVYGIEDEDGRVRERFIFDEVLMNAGE